MAADPTPMKWWGLDPLHRAHLKLYVADILGMARAASAQGVYFYRNHAVTHVDVMGAVVEVRERERFTAYALDDGTGVITCLCWKEPERRGGGVGGTGSHPGAAQAAIQDVLVSVLRREAESSRVQLGDWLHVLGSVCCRWETREIHASYYSRVFDPACVLIERPREQVRLYTQYYDKEYAWSGKGRPLRGESDVPLGLLCDGILTFLKDNRVQSVNSRELQSVDSLAALAVLVERDEDRSGTSAQGSSRQETVHVTKPLPLHGALRKLELDGFVYRHPTNNELYLVTDLDVGLRENVLRVVRRKCTGFVSRQRGVSLGDITCEVQRLCEATVLESHVKRVLAVLVERSDLLCQENDLYIAF